MPDTTDPIPSQPSPDPDMPPRKAPAGGGGGKLKKPLTDKQRAAAEERLARLRASLDLRPMDAAPAGRAFPAPHEDALRALKLLDFARLDLHSEEPRPDLIAPLVAYYDPACKRSFVRGVRVAVSRHDLSRALSLPPKPASGAAAPADVDPAAVASAVMQLLQEFVLLPFQGDDMCILPQEVAAAEQSVREGEAHKVDWAGLIWGLVEKEILDLHRGDDGACYFGPHLQRLIRTQKPKLFEQVEEEDREEIVLEVSVDVEMDEEDGDADADVKSKSLEELDLGDADADADVRSQSLEEPQLGNSDARNDGLEDLELGDAATRSRVMEELGLGDANTRNNKEDLEDDGNARSKSLNESGVVDEDARSKSLDESGVVTEDAECTGLHGSEAGHEDEKGTNLDELGLGSVTIEPVPAAQEVMLSNNEDAPEAAPEPIDDVAVAAEEDAEGPLVETVVVTQEEVVAVAEDVVDEEAEGEEEKDAEGEEEMDATGLSLGINSSNGYDSMDAEEDTNVENLEEIDSDNEEAEESEDDAFEECNGGEDMNWRIGDGKEDEGMTQCLQRCNTFGMEFENLNKGDAEMRDELRFDDFSGRGSLERMTSSNLLQAMNSIPASYNVTENVHDLSSGEFLAMGADANKSGVDLGPGSSYLFGNNGKRHISEIDGYNDNVQVQEQFSQCSQQKRMRHNNGSSISSGSAFFNANFSVPIQNLMAEASRLVEQKDQELQTLQSEKQQWFNVLQQKEAIIQSLNSARFEQQNKYQAELRRYEHDLNNMAQLVTAYKKALKQTRASFDEYRRKYPCNKPLYGDVAGGSGLVLSVRELERRQFEEQQRKLAEANEMIEKFQYEWFSKLEEWEHSVNSLWSRMEKLHKEIDLVKENRRARFATSATEESVPLQSASATEESVPLQSASATEESVPLQSASATEESVPLQSEVQM